MVLRYTDRAAADLEAAFSWYERQRAGLGFDFLDCVEESVKYILSMPHGYQAVHSNFRRCTIKRFPFSIFYTVETDGIIVHAVFDNRQNPDKQPQ